jgi:hypothetical protein
MDSPSPWMRLPGFIGEKGSPSAAYVLTEETDQRGAFIPPLKDVLREQPSKEAL